MPKKEKRMLTILVIVAVVIIGGLLLWSKLKNKGEENKEEEETNTEKYVTVLEDGTKLNISEKLKEEKTIDGLKIDNIQLTEQNGQTVLLADVTNETESDTTAIGINIIILDESGNEIATIPGVISPIKAGATKQLNVGITEDYANAYSFKIEKQ